MESKIETTMESKIESKMESKKRFSWAMCCAGMAEEPAEVIKAAEELAAKAGVSDVTVQEILEKIAEEITPTSGVAKEAEAKAEETTAPQTTSV